MISLNVDSSQLPFRHHLARHDNNRPFYCNASGCNLRFYTKTALNMHMPKHSVETPYLCPICSKGFKWKHGLNSHLIVHSDEKKLLCDECGYSTSHLKTLRTHQLSHTGFVFRCTSSGCSYTSRRKENLKIHTATHKNETPFVCEICGHRFSQNKNLKVRLGRMSEYAVRYMIWIIGWISVFTAPCTDTCC